MLIVYKGYEVNYLEKIKAKELVNSTIDEKININDENKTAQDIISQLTASAETLQKEERWITYEEFSVSYKTIISLADIFKIKIQIDVNNKYYNIYPLEIYDSSRLEEIISKQSDDMNSEDQTSAIYSYIYKIDNNYYAQYHNYEYDYTDKIEVKQRYNGENVTLQREYSVDYIFEISENKELYLKNILECTKYKRIGITTSLESNITKEMFNGLVGFLNENGYLVFMYYNIDKEQQRHEEYIRIAQNEIGIPGFESFKQIEIYENPVESNKIITITQEDIINEIVNQIEKSKNIDEENNNFYRDVFVTAPTGAGKSVMFQIPAVYAANKFGALSIVISPLVELMNDQVDNLQRRGYHRAARLNSDVNAFEKEEILEKIDKGEIDILYLSPEALLSYSIESIIGTRDIAMVIVDEAHIVTTWGQGFRPDYWYLGTYFEKLRRSRYKRGVLDKNSKIYKFPICTFTATAVYGGEDDGVLELAESLYLRDPVKFIGKVRRKDISFDIKVHNEKMNSTEYKIEKAKSLKAKIEEWKNKKEKSLIYFPYNSIAKDAYFRRSEFELLDNDDKNIGIYTGQTDKVLKKESAAKYKNGAINIMFATKAFGMGIDIKDIKNVYHYAEAGNLNDYVQEIGRAARDKDMVGTAYMDYYEKDENFAKILFGMSAIKQYHVNGCIRVLNNIYKKSKRRNNLITPQAFETVFPKSNDLENTVKTALLNIEKDFNAKYRIPVIITRPRSMFTSTYTVIEKKIENEFLNSEFGKYFKLINKGRIGEKELKYIVTDLGDIYSVNLKKMWEDKFSNLSFPQFKHKFYAEKDKVLGEYAKSVFDRTRIEIQMLDEESTFEGIKEKLLYNVNIVSNILAKFQSKQGEFTMQEFKKELNDQFKNTIIAENIANGYFKCLENQLLIKSFYTTKNVGETVKYRIVSSSYRTLAETLIFKSGLLKELNECKEHCIVKYKSIEKESMKKNSRILNLLSMFNMIQYDMYGGENPEIFIRINDPERIRSIAEGEIKYNNQIVQRASEKHARDIKVLRKFILELEKDDERWEYIERYFLGKDVLET